MATFIIAALVAWCGCAFVVAVAVGRAFAKGHEPAPGTVVGAGLADHSWLPRPAAPADDMRPVTH
jgi:hypothetical protein